MKDIIKVEGLDMPELDVFVRLTGAQLRSRIEPERGIFIAESPTVIEVALNTGCVPVSVLTDLRLISGVAGKVLERIEREFPDVPIYGAEREVLTALTGFELTRGALCAMKRPTLPDASEILKGGGRVAIFESITDSTNIGALFRSAAALGIDGILITPSCCDPLSRRALRVSMGTVLQVPYARIGETAADWPEKGMALLAEHGFRTAAMALSDDSVSIDDPALSACERLAIVLGTEGDGLKKETIAKCDFTVKIPMYHGVDSLNVAAAGAVAFWELTKVKR